MPDIDKRDSSSDLTILKISFIFSLEIINVAVTCPNNFLWIGACIAVAATVNPNGIKTLLANGFNTFFIQSNPVFSTGPKSLPKNPTDCPILYNWVFDNFVLAKKLFTRAQPSFETCVLVNKNLWGKSFSSLESPTMFDEIFKVNSLPFFISNFNLLSYWN